MNYEEDIGHNVKVKYTITGLSLLYKIPIVSSPFAKGSKMKSKKKNKKQKTKQNKAIRILFLINNK